MVLDHADTVLHLVNGKITATGTHHELLTREPAYRALVARDAGEQEEMRGGGTGGGGTGGTGDGDSRVGKADRPEANGSGGGERAGAEVAR